MYHIDTPMKSFDLLLQLCSLEGSSKESGGRQWAVLSDYSGIYGLSQVWNEEGTTLFEMYEKNARESAARWLGKLTKSVDQGEAFRDTLPPSQRVALTVKSRGKSEAELNKLAEADADVRAYLERLKQFRAGSLVRTGSKAYFSTTNHRDEILNEVKKKFLSTASPETWLLLSATMPTWSWDDQTLTFAYDFVIPLLPRYVASGRLTVETGISALKDPQSNKPDSWRIVALEIDRGQSAPQAEAGSTGRMRAEPTIGQP
jgi:hypothetical protein